MNNMREKNLRLISNEQTPIDKVYGGRAKDDRLTARPMQDRLRLVSRVVIAKADQPLTLCDSDAKNFARGLSLIISDAEDPDFPSAA
jgi:hypothetical protein